MREKERCNLEIEGVFTQKSKDGNKESQELKKFREEIGERKLRLGEISQKETKEINCILFSNVRTIFRLK